MESRARSNINVLAAKLVETSNNHSLLSYNKFHRCCDSSQADVQADAVRPHLTHMLEEWKDAGWRLGVGLVLERATGRPLVEVQGPWRLEKGASRDVLPASAPRVVAQEFDASGV